MNWTNDEVNVVIDQVASLTDPGAVTLHNRLINKA